MSEIFISYSRLDRETVDRLMEELARRGFDVWVDRKDIDGGSDWRAAISQSIRNCRAFLAVLSSNSTGSKKVVQELALADQHRRQIIPLRLDTCEIPADMELQLSTLQWIDFTERSFDEAVDQIESALTKKKRVKPESPLPVDKTNHQLQKQTKLPETEVTQQPSLASMLPGVWQIQISNPFGVMGQMTVELFANAMFRGQIVGPGGQSAVQGMWQITQLNQLVLQGQGTNGFITMPYHTVVQFTNILPNHLAGLSSVGEQIVCQKIS